MPNSREPTIQEQIIALRIQRKWTQTELGLRLGISQSAVSQLELSNSNPTVSRLTDVARAFGMRLVFSIKKL